MRNPKAKLMNRKLGIELFDERNPDLVFKDMTATRRRELCAEDLVTADLRPSRILLEIMSEVFVTHLFLENGETVHRIRFSGDIDADIASAMVLLQVLRTFKLSKTQYTVE
jgi:hypothetical protein